VWFDEELGELAKHLWHNVSSLVMEYHNRPRAWIWASHAGTPQSRLEWYITNYDYIRTRANLVRKKLVLDPFLDGICTSETLLVLDESSAVKNPKAKQTKASLWIRGRCGRVVLLNGTPISNSPLDMYAQGRIMHPAISGHSSFYTFRAKYAVVVQTDAGFPKITGWQNLDDLQRRFAPYVLRRLKKDCLDLPEKLPSVPLIATLTPATWRAYREMRDELCAYLSETTVTMAAQAGVKVMRLAQITSGFVGGVETAIYDGADTIDVEPVRQLSHEKLDLYIGWLETQMEQDPSLKLVTFMRFRPQLEALVSRLYKTKGLCPENVGQIHGGQPAGERDRALRLLDPRTMPKGPAIVAGITATGSMGLNLTAAHTVVYLSNDFSLKTRLQSEDRVHRPGQHCDVAYFDVVATGPDGQKTVDHLIQKTLRMKLDVATWTSSAWVQALREE
jgi:hypothetical protein